MNEWQWRLVFEFGGMTTPTASLATTTTPEAPDCLLRAAAALSARLGVGVDVQRKRDFDDGYYVKGDWILDQIVRDLPARSDDDLRRLAEEARRT